MQTPKSFLQWLVFLTIFFLPLSACSGNDDPVGIWEVNYQDAVGQHYHDVLELKKDGTYIRYGTTLYADRGKYSFKDNIIYFESDVNSNIKLQIPYKRPDSNSLRFEPIVPPNSSQQWTRVNYPPYFRTVEIDDRFIPAEIEQLMLTALQNESQGSYSDIIPTGIDINELKNGQYQINFTFLSSSNNKMLNIRVKPYDLSVKITDNTGFRQIPITSGFLDFPEIISAAKKAGLKGPVKRADLKAYGKYGAVWFINTPGQAANISAATGEHIKEDVTGYIANYEADWNHAAQIWAEVMAKYTKKDDKDEGFWSKDHSKYTNSASCNQNGGVWMVSGGGWCN
ncbi:MAG: hypothetical protein KDF58_05450 [Alphaproteobacteria bacterium]|nr:hypothetical protein [Alphaproteobacteria bacterium]